MQANKLAGVAFNSYIVDEIYHQKETIDVIYNEKIKLAPCGLAKKINLKYQEENFDRYIRNEVTAIHIAEI